MEWYGLVTMETEGCNSARPEGNAAEALMTEEGGTRSPEYHETVPSTEK